MKNRLSRASLVFCYLVMLGTAFLFYPRWHKPQTNATIAWDVSGYYMYLPALFIYKDLKHCTFKDSILAKYYPTPDFQQAFIHQKSGNYVMKYSSGQAFAMLPFFILAHSYCHLTGAYPADGFSYPYQACIGIGMLLYAFLGLFVLRKVLLPYFKDATVALLLLCYVLGTNYLDYSSIDQGMTHSVLFTLYCLVLYTTARFYAKPSIVYALALGLLVGYATLIRPTDIVAVLIPLCWNINGLKGFKQQVEFIKQHFFKFAIIAIALFLVFAIQMVYWKYVANEWFVYSYQDQGFSWLHPHFYDYILSYSCGWLRYCPMMMLPILGLVYFFIKGKNSFAIVLVALVNFYVVIAWDVWDYGGTAGRAMIQTYPILAFPFCMLLEWAQRRKWTSLLLHVLLALFTYLNIWWTYHAHAGNIQVTGMTKAYFWKMLGRWDGTDADKKLLDNPQEYFGRPQHSTLIYSNNYDRDTSANAIRIGTESRIRVSKDLQHADLGTIPNSPTIKKWIRASADFYCVLKEWDMWKQAQFALKFFKGTELVQVNFIRVHRLLSHGETRRIHIDAIVPSTKWDQVNLSIWNAGGDQELQIDNLEVISFDD